MPSSLVKARAKKHKMTEAAVEKIWNKAKKKAEKQGHGSQYAYIVSIFETMMKNK